MSLYTKIIDLQKMQQAWERVKKNKPAAGVDRVTFEMFDQRKREELKQLQIELQQHTYETLPVKQIILYKEEKERPIALYSMRDKVLQQSLALELGRIYDQQFSEYTYAYRSNKSALTALDEINTRIQSGKYEAALRVDIHHFFDTIKWEILEKKLRQQISEDDVIELIKKNSITPRLTEDGELIERSIGIHQGSAIAPILSNVYLMEFDLWLQTKCDFFIRYSDDLLILGEKKDELLHLLTEIKQQLYALGLEVNETKTVCVDLEEGIDFLGHRFNKMGKFIPQKAEENLQSRLEIMWLTSNLTFEEKVNKAIAIIGGWEQYFREEREIQSIFEFLAILTASQNNEAYRNELAEKRKQITNIYKDIAIYLGQIWKQYNMPAMELYEYEEFCMQDTAKIGQRLESEQKWLSEVLQFYRVFLIEETAATATELMQLYTDMYQFTKAAFWQKKSRELEETVRKPEERIIQETNRQTDTDAEFNKGTVNRLMKYFVGREDVYSLESLGVGEKRQTETQLLPLTEEQVMKHLQGTITLGTYLQRPNATVKFIVLDVDISKRILLQYDRSTPEFSAYLVRAQEKAAEVIRQYRKWGIEGYSEYSGCRGYHVWLLFTEWIPLRYANMFCELVERTIPSDPDITIEFFPNKTHLKPGHYGQCIKLPFGRHIRTGELSYFLDEYGNRIVDTNQFLDSMARFQLPAIKKILAANTGFKDNGNQTISIDLESFGEIPASVRMVLEKCNLMKYLCQKAMATGYLSHFERLSILYVFGHLGDEGKEFIHSVMSKTLNYQYNTTERFINKIPEKPISCVKLREQYKSITAEYGCSCTFKHAKNCYPSPVLHAISLSKDTAIDVTIPTSRTLSRESEQKVLDEMNIHRKAEELAGKILELKKQRRKLDASISKNENELCKIYDFEKIDCLEIEMGLLVRRKTEKGYEWLIEI